MDRPNEPFCYFSKPVDVIGVMDGREGTLITPEGYFYAGSGELMFFFGSAMQPVDQRVKTLLDGYLPVNEYEFTDEGLGYAVTSFAATLDGNPESPLINFIRVRLSNTCNAKRTAWWGAGVRYQNDANTDWEVGDNRFGRPVPAQRKGEFEQLGEAFNPEWEYAFQQDVFLRDGRLLYMFPNQPQPLKSMTMKMGYNEEPDANPGRRTVLPTTPMGIVRYQIPLQPGEWRDLIFKFPYLSMDTASVSLGNLRTAGFNQYLENTTSFWNNLLNNGTDIMLPEDKVNNTFKASLIYDLIARDKIGDDYVQRVNEFQYDAFWLRDAAFIAYMYDLTGYPREARRVLDFFPPWQSEDGNFVSHGGQFDGWGQVLWIYNQHYKMTGDRAFAEKVYPSVVKALAWLRQARKSDPWRLMPESTPGDNELISGHVTGHNLWALIGLKNAAEMAQSLSKTDEAGQFGAEYDDLYKALLDRLDVLTKSSGGYIPPGLDRPGGQDWGNLLGIWPEKLFDINDRRITATLDSVYKKYREGIMTYGDGRYLHHYLTIRNMQSALIRGDQEQALKEFYAVLIHTSATHTGFEFSIRPWGDRDFGMNLSPHGWFAAEFRTVLRNMLLREEDGDLHLLSCLSPEWLKPGSGISVKRAPTYFGTVNFEIKTGADRFVLNMNNDFNQNPRNLKLHLPWFMNIKKMSADGHEVKAQKGIVTLGPAIKKIEITGPFKNDISDYSFDKAVKDFKAEYARRYQEFLQKGNLNSE